MNFGDVVKELRAALVWGAPETKTVEGVEYVLVPHGMNLKDIPEKHGINPAPKRKTGSYALHEEADFVRFVKAHKAGGTRIYADLSKDGEPKFTAVFNDHGGGDEDDANKGTPGWADFRAVFGCPLSEDWKVWKALNDVTVAENYQEWLSPAEFAEFIEDHVHTIAEPRAGDLIALGRNVVVEQSTQVVNVREMDEGRVEVHYKEDASTPQSKDGKLKLPKTLELALPVFRVPGEADPSKEAAGVVQVKCMVRFRVISQRLVIGVKMDRPELVLEKEFRAMASRIGNETNKDPLYGLAPAARA